MTNETGPTASAATISSPAIGHRLNVLGEAMTIVARAADDSHVVLDVLSRAAPGPPLHRHRWQETYFIIAGAMDMRVGDQRMRVAAGTTVHCPAGTPKWYSTRDTGECRFLAILSPASAAEFFAEVPRVIAPDAPDMPKLQAVCRRFGVDILGEPGA